MLLKSFTQDKNGNDIAQASNLQYSSKQMAYQWAYEYVGKNYTAEVGYVPRKDYVKIKSSNFKIFFSERWNYFNAWSAAYNANYFFDTKMHNTDHETVLTYLFTFRRKAHYQC